MKKKKLLINSSLHILLIVLAIIWLIPLAWLLLQSFRAGRGSGAAGILPAAYTFDNYIKLFTETGTFNFPRWFMNTLFVASVSCVITTIVTLFTSYAFSRLRFKMKKKIMNLLLVIGMFPGFMAMTAIYYFIKNLGLAQSLWALILVYSGGAAMGYYITKGFFDTIPYSIDESAMLDGANKNQIFWKIILPMSKPIVIYTALTAFIAPWLDFVFASVILGEKYESYTVAIGLYKMISRENITYYFTQFCAGAVIVSIPIALLFIFMQKYYVSGVTGGSVKG